MAGVMPSWSCCWSADGTDDDDKPLLLTPPPSWPTSELASCWPPFVAPFRPHEEMSDEVEEADDEDEFDMVELVLEADDDDDDEVLKSRHWLMQLASACGSTSGDWPLNLPLALLMLRVAPMRCCWW